MKQVPRWGICPFAVLLLVISSAAQGDPQALVAKMVHNELAAGKNSQAYWMYVDSKTQGNRTEVSRVIETPECWLTWPLSVGGSASANDEQKQRAQVQKLVSDPAACHKQRAELSQDSHKADALLRILPDAFLYIVESRQDGKITLNFRPNPQFHPATREAKVFHHMQGTLVIDEKETRLVSLSGTLMSNVTLGGGILADLHKGGTFHVVQSEVAPRDWELTLLDVHINGRALFFKTISEQQHEAKGDFQAVPAGITLTQAASMVEQASSPASASAEHSQ